MKSNSKIYTIVLLMIVGAFARLIPHMPNFTPVEGLTIFGAAYLGKKYWAFILPLIVLYISDFIINNTIARPFFTEQEGIIWFSDYMIYGALAIGLIVLISSKLLKVVNFKNVFVSAILASLVFFVISNFGAWAGSTSIYSKDLSGLIATYIAGIPFFRTSLLSSFVFTAILFGSYYMIQSMTTSKNLVESA